MFKRSFSVAVCAPLALMLTVMQASAAVFFPIVTVPAGREGTISAFGSTNYNYYPSSFGSTYGTPFYSSYSSYSVNTATPLYYGGASFAPSYSTAFTPPRLVSPPLDSLNALDRAASAAYASPTYPLRTPDYNVVYPISPPLAQLADNTARVEVRVAAGAELWFDGHATSQTGALRSFTTPALEQNQDYVYDVRARWDADGKPVDQTRKVIVHAGDHIVVDFHRN